MRMNWKDDQHLYQPRIHSDRIRGLHQVREETGEPMTVLIDRAIRQFVDRELDIIHDEEILYDNEDLYSDEF